MIPLAVPLDLQFFAKEGPGGEKTEEPTAKRLNEARDEGNVAKSQEINQAFSLLALFLLIRFLIGWLGLHFRNFIMVVYEDIPSTIQMYDGMIPLRAILGLITKALLNVLLFCSPFFIAGFAIAFLTNLIQVKWHVSTKPLKPKLSKLNPISGVKKIFSVQKLFELAKAIAKLAVLGLVVYFYLRGRKESIYLLYDMPLRQGLAAMFDIVVGVGTRIALVYMIIAAVDYIYQKHKFHEDMKMTKQEVKDEYKNQEGDPQIKSKQRQRMMEASRRRMMSALPQADVVITNPTHYAVALRYDQDHFRAPIVIAKGADHLAAKIREVAKEHDIEIVEDKPLARMLYANVPIGAEIPAELYEAVANVLAFVYRIKGKV
ncbi:MAG: flagellar biosynthesis protein FlhB [Lachnospiraceae bacterium]|nr:flagellar biosynthesis protein FlhB [Lachnospiraceae bacterium]